MTRQRRRKRQVQGAAVPFCGLSHEATPPAPPAPSGEAGPPGRRLALTQTLAFFGPVGRSKGNPLGGLATKQPQPQAKLRSRQTGWSMVVVSQGWGS